MLTLSPSIHLAIIGGGPASVSLCLQLAQAFRAQKHQVKMRIFIFEKKADIGFGLPYALEEPSFCINLPKEYMVLMPAEYEHFSRWLNEAYPNETSRFPPRHYFGQYAKERMDGIQKSEGLEILIFTQHEVLEVSTDEHHQYHIHTQHQQHKQIYQVDYVILATGHLPKGLFSHLHQFAQYQTNPWDLQAYQRLPTHAHVGIIGSRLTAIDVALKLHHQNHQGKISMLSRSGLLSSVRGHHPTPHMRYLTPASIQKILTQTNAKTLLHPLFQLFEQELTLHLSHSFLDTLTTIRNYSPLTRLEKEIHLVESQQTTWQSVLSCFYQIIFKIWPTLSLAEQRYFLKTQSKLLLTFLCSFPLDKAYVLRSMMHAQQLSIHGGLLNIEKITSGFSIQLPSKAMEVDYLILAVSSDHSLENIPLFTKMLQRQLIKKHPLGGLCIYPKTHQVLSSNPNLPNRMYALGDLVKGACFTMIEVGQVVEQAKIISEHIMKESVVNP